MHNLEIRETAKASGVMLWEIAEKYGVSDSNFSRKMRRELPEQEKTKIFAIIQDIAEKKNQ